MKDIDAIKKKVMSSIENRVNSIYNVGYENGYADGQKHDLEHTENIVRSHEKCKSVLEAEYEHGLNDAWKCVRRFLNTDGNTCDKIFGCYMWKDFMQLSPSEAIEKFKEYDEKQNSKIEVGDEVIYHDPRKGDEKGVAIGMCGEWVEVKFPSSWNCVGIYKDSVKKTGRHFDEMDKLLKELEEKDA